MIKRGTICLLIILFLHSAIAQAIALPAHLSREEIFRYYDIPLDYKLQKYIIEESIKNNLDPELIIAIIGAETRGTYKIDFINKNKDGTQDIGLMQLNSRYIEEFKKDMRDMSLNENCPEDNIKIGIFILKRNEDYWKNKGYKGIKLRNLMLSSYNRGLYGTIKKGIRWPYIRLVNKYLKEVKKCNLKLVIQ